jgi:hypothetical protein
MSTILGANLTEQPIKFGWSRERGPYTTKEWRGAEAQIRAKMSEVVAQGASWDIERLPGDIWRIVAQFATSEGAGGGSTGGAEITETWELLPKDCAKDLLSSSADIVAGLTQEEIEDIQNNLNAGRKSEFMTHLSGDALTVFKLMRAGVQHEEIEQPVLSHNWMVPVNATLAYTYPNLGRIFSTSSLISNEGVPGYLKRDIEAWTASFTNPGYGDDRVELVYGWRKRAPTQRVTNDSRREVSQTWEFGLWSPALRGPVI